MSQYTCALCGGIFNKVETEKWNTEKALAEFKSKFPDEQKEDVVLVCDDCYKIAIGVKADDNLAN